MIRQKEFYLVGVETRTNNKNEVTGQGEIPKLWEKVFKEDVKGRVPNSLGVDAYAVYSNYESDENGDYDFFIGYRVNDLNVVPAGLSGKKVEEGQYKFLETNKGIIYQVVAELWLKIWKMNKEELGGERAFKTDYEVYGLKAQDPNNAVVEVYLGIK